MGPKLLPNLIFLMVLAFAHAASESDDVKFTALMERVVRLEARDSEHQREIAALNQKVATIERSASERETELLNELQRVKSAFLRNGGGNVDTSNEENVVEVTKHAKEVKDITQQDRVHEKRSAIARQAVEMEVAFYATHTQHDVQHLAQNTIIAFDQDVSNVGNAYNPNQGTFAAPIDGVYVFHVTVMGLKTHSYTGHHYSAYIDVNGVAYSQLWVTSYDQSSQMFVIELKQGSTVSVKNGHQDEALVGQHMSSFSGFLLYQRDYSAGIIGK